MTGPIADAPPMAHAVSGSLGSALALLLLYPLERARVELQTLTASSAEDDDNYSNNNDNVDGSGDNDDGSFQSTAQSVQQRMSRQTQPLLAQERLEWAARGGGGTPVASEQGVVCVLPPLRRGDEKEERKKQSTLASSSDDELSWESCHRHFAVGDDVIPVTSSEEGEIPPSIASAAAAVGLQHQELQPSNQRQKQKQKLGLLSCLVQLHQRGELYHGVTPVVTTLVASNFVFFYMHSFLKQLLIPDDKYKAAATSDGSSRKKLHLSLLASSLAGIINVLLTNPLWVANLRIVTSGNNNQDTETAKSNNNLWQEIKHVVQTEGWAHLWNGTPASLLLVSNPVIQFFAYEQLKNQLLLSLRARHATKNSVALKPLEAFVLGALAKAISTILTYPLQLTQTVLRVQKQELVKRSESVTSDDATPTTSTTSGQKPKYPHTTHYRTTLDCLLKIYKNKGLEGWFAGMRTKLLQTVLTAALTFLTYEQIIRAIMAVHKALSVKGVHHHSIKQSYRAPVP
jgi:adenine nucleotide transporter 17